MSDDRKLPASNQDSDAVNQTGNHLYVGELNYHANDLSELRRLSETNPELANKIVDNQERASARLDRSYRIGLIVASAIAVSLVAGGAYVVVGIGWWQALIFVTILLGASHLLTAILTGKFSETSWFGQIISGQKTPPSDE